VEGSACIAMTDQQQRMRITVRRRSSCSQGPQSLPASPTSAFYRFLPAAAGGTVAAAGVAEHPASAAAWNGAPRLPDVDAAQAMGVQKAQPVHRRVVFWAKISNRACVGNVRYTVLCVQPYAS
jgi:hypothetical protein